MSEPQAEPCEPGQPWPLGVTVAEHGGVPGLNVAVPARDATGVEVCWYSDDGEQETARHRLGACSHGVWHGFVPGLAAGQRYGLRAHGPWQPEAGHLFNPARLLVDPWARSLSGPLRELAREIAYQPPADDAPDAPLQPDPHDNAARMPKARALDLAAELQAGAAIAPGPGTPHARSVIYEAHVKALTMRHPEVPEAERGSYAAVASDAMLAHYRALGITALCLLPVHLHVDEAHLLDLDLANHWGYNTLGFFVPDPRLASAAARAGGHDDAGVRAEFRQMVDRLHRAGIEVLLDVVYNHSAEGGALGPTLAWRGLGQAEYYALAEGGTLHNDSGCGNTFDFGSPAVVQMVLDSLRWWVQAYGVDGFRFDLAATLGRDPALGYAFSPYNALLAALAQDPVLARCKLIAEPWDVGAGGYQLGAFGPRWQEWNDRFRDHTRAWWLGHASTRGEMARRLTASSDVFEPGGRAPTASINLITAHDGFTLHDLTAYADKHNEANGEDNRDGHSHNLSANGGHEGPTDDESINARRGRWRRALLASLFCAQGVPQLLAGDELGHSQQGNNNAYCQDNALTWLDWAQADAALRDFVAGLAALRQRWPALRHTRWFHGETPEGQPWPDIEWRTADGSAPEPDEWEQPNGRLLACVITVGEAGHAATARLMLILHADEDALSVALPEGPWHCVLDSAAALVLPGELVPHTPVQAQIQVPGQTVMALVQPLAELPDQSPPADAGTPP